MKTYKKPNYRRFIRMDQIEHVVIKGLYPRLYTSMELGGIFLLYTNCVHLIQSGRYIPIQSVIVFDDSEAP